MKKITIKGLADFMTASQTRQRALLKQFKYPDAEDARAKIIYYREARDRIEVLHRSGHDSDWLIEESAGLDSLARASAGRTRLRLSHNARALRAYAKNFAERRFEVLADLHFRLSFDDVVVSVAPDLHVEERGKKKVIKFEFGVEPPHAQEIKVISQVMFEAFRRSDTGLQPSAMLYLDVARGAEYRGARLGSRLKRDIESACLNISAIWDRI